jgi:hypothetical protein
MLPRRLQTRKASELVWPRFGWSRGPIKEGSIDMARRSKSSPDRAGKRPSTTAKAASPPGAMVASPKRADSPPRGRVVDSPPRGRVVDSPPRGRVVDSPPRGRVVDSPPRGAGMVASPPRSPAARGARSPARADSPPRVATVARAADSPPRAARRKRGAAAVAGSPPGAMRADSPPGAMRADSPPGAMRADSPPTGLASPPTLRSPALRSLVRSLTRPSFRKAFAVDPLRAIERAGLDVSGLPAGQLEVLAALPVDELDIVVSVLARLREVHPGRILSL